MIRPPSHRVFLTPALRLTLALVIAALLAARSATAQQPTRGGTPPASDPPPSAEPSAAAIVVEELVATGEPARQVIERLFARAAQTDSSTSAVRKWVKPTDRVGIKITANGVGRDVLDSVIGILRSAGVSSGRILVWDRSPSALTAAGYLDARRRSLINGIRVRWIEPGAGYIREPALFAPAAGSLIFGDVDFRPGTTETQVGNFSYLSFILTNEVDKVIILAPARAARGIGIAGAVAGGLLDNVDNWRRFYRQGGGNGLAEMWAASGISPKIVLALADARTVQIAGGPGRNAIYERPHGTIASSTDPFALDRRLVEILDPMATVENLPSPRARASWLRED